MRSIAALILVLSFSSVASAQVGSVQVLGPYQPNPYGGYVYFQPAFRNPYVGYVAAPAYRGYDGYLDRVRFNARRSYYRRGW